MARKPHNYVHFQNLVEELKSHNELNNEMIAEKLDQNNAILTKMLNFDVTKIKNDKIKDKEDRLEDKPKKWKGLDSKSSVKLPRFSGKGFMGMLGDFLSTALLGIPGGLRKFLPAKLGMGLMGTLVRGMALLVAGPNLLNALEAAFKEEDFSGGLTTFINKYFASDGEGYKGVFEAAYGGVYQGALLGLIAGPKGAIIGGLIGGAISGLNHIFTDGGKMDFKTLKTKMKEHLKENLKFYAAVGIGAKMASLGFKAGGIRGMIAGGILGAGIGLLSGDIIKKALEAQESNPELSFGQALSNAFKQHFIEVAESPGPWAAGGAILGGIMGGSFGPPGIIAGMLLGAALGLLTGPVLGEAFKIQESTGADLSKAFKEALWKKVSEGRLAGYIKSAAFGAALFGTGALFGLGPVGFLAGAIIGAVVGILMQWLTNIAVDILGPKLAKLFGIEKIIPQEVHNMKKNAELSLANKKFEETWNTTRFDAKNWLRAGKQSSDGQSMNELIDMYRKLLLKKHNLMEPDESKHLTVEQIHAKHGFNEKIARQAAQDYDWTYRGVLDTDESEFDALRLAYNWDNLRKAKMAYDAKQLAADPTFQPVPLSEYRDSSINIRNTISTESQFATWMSTLVDPMVPNQ